MFMVLLISRSAAYSNKSLPVQGQQQKHQKKALNMYKANKSITSFWCLYCIIIFKPISHLFPVFLLTLNR